MGGFLNRPGTNTTQEGALLTQLFNLSPGGPGTAIQKFNATTFVNITVGNASTEIFGAGVANQVTYFTASQSIGGNGAFTFNPINNTLSVLGSVGIGTTVPGQKLE